MSKKKQNKGIEKMPIEMFAYIADDKGIGQRNTVSNGPDDGTLNKNAACFWNCRRHGTTSQMVDNLLISVTLKVTPPLLKVFGQAGMCNIGGHGNTGLVETGMGQTGPFNMNQIIMTWNESTWGPQLDRLIPTPITMISIWACHTGEGQSGSDLLYAMALRVGRAVQAGTGFLYTNGQTMWWENGSVWQVATPNSHPAPIAAPSPHPLILKAPKFEVSSKEFETTEIVELTFSPRDIRFMLLPSKTIKGKEVKMLAEKLFISHALEMNMSIMGMVTAQLTVKFKSGESIDFDIYNDRLAVDTKSKTAYYINTAFRNLIEMI